MAKKIMLLANLVILAALVFMLSRPLLDGDFDAATGIAEPEAHLMIDNVPAREHPEASLPEPQPEDYQALTESDLFGTIALQRRQAPREEPQPVTESADILNLNLLGTVAGGSRLARAIIQPEREKRQGIYSVGDTVEGAEIIDISRKRVILTRDGIYYELTMDMTQVIEKEDAEAAGIVSEDDFADIVVVGEDGVIEMDRQAALERGGGMFAIMRQLQDNLSVEQYIHEGEVAGLKLRGVDKIGVAQLAGVQEGDVVKSVDGEVISSLPQALQVFRRVRHLDKVEVQLMRDGETVKRTYNFR